MNGSTRFFVKGIFSTITLPFGTISQIKWHFFSMCLPLRWFLISLDNATTPLFTQNSIMGCTTHKFHKELLKTNDFLCYFKSCNVLGFPNEVRITRLLHTSLTNSCNTKSKYKTRGRLM